MNWPEYVDVRGGFVGLTPREEIALRFAVAMATRCRESEVPLIFVAGFAAADAFLAECARRETERREAQREKP